LLPLKISLLMEEITVPLKVGIPRALLYYYYYPLWRTFFTELGAEVVLSQPSNKGILEAGLQKAVDEVCFPVKLAYGHVLDLADKADLIFLPRLVSVAKREYVCPKFMGLPDMIRRIKGLPPLIDPCINFNKGNLDLSRRVQEAGRLLGVSNHRVWLSYLKASKIQARYVKLLRQGFLPPEALETLKNSDQVAPTNKHKKNGAMSIAVLGHPYNIYDSFASMNLIERLQNMGANIVAAEALREQTVKDSAARYLSKKLFWTLGRRMVGAAFDYMERRAVTGIVHVAAFGCGPDSMTGELIERHARLMGIPFLNITLDEHTAEAGLLTRLEAFMDMLRWREAGAAYV
jgi:predicted nucleotide-binding protein (sugar kinase/HSP70/actin superfamily)